LHPQKVHSSVRKNIFFPFFTHATAITPLKFICIENFQCSENFFFTILRIFCFSHSMQRAAVGCCVHYTSSTHAENENEMRLNSLNFLYFVNFFLLLHPGAAAATAVPHSTLPFCVMYNEYFA